jgi:hypothetical protein
VSRAPVNILLTFRACEVPPLLLHLVSWALSEVFMRRRKQMQRRGHANMATLTARTALPLALASLCCLT